MCITSNQPQPLLSRETYPGHTPVLVLIRICQTNNAIQAHRTDPPSSAPLKMTSAHVPPMLFEILQCQPPVTMLRCCFTAQQHRRNFEALSQNVRLHLARSD